MKVNDELLDDIIRNGRKNLKYEEVIEIIKDLSDRGYKTYRRAKEIAIEALEKQIELEPMYNWGVTSYCPPDYGGEEFDEYGWIPSCPRCTRVINNFTTRCECGQAIKRIKTYPTGTMD